MKFYVAYNLIMQLFGVLMLALYLIKFYPEAKPHLRNKKLKPVLIGMAFGVLILVFDLFLSIYLLII